MKVYSREYRYSPTHSYLGTTWKRVMNFTPRPLYPQDTLSIAQKAGWAAGRSGGFGQEINLLPRPVFEPRVDYAIPASLLPNYKQITRPND